MKLRVVVSHPLIGERVGVYESATTAERIDHLLKHAWRDLGAFVVTGEKCQTFTVTIHAEDCAEAIEAERLAMNAYVTHLDHCEAGCRPEAARSSAVGFAPGTGAGCVLGKQLAEGWQRAQSERRHK